MMLSNTHVSSRLLCFSCRLVSSREDESFKKHKAHTTSFAGTRRRYSSYNIAVAGLTEAQEEVCPLILSPRPGNRISNDAVASI